MIYLVDVNNCWLVIAFSSGNLGSNDIAEIEGTEVAPRIFIQYIL